MSELNSALPATTATGNTGFIIRPLVGPMTIDSWKIAADDPRSSMNNETLGKIYRSIDKHDRCTIKVRPDKATSINGMVLAKAKGTVVTGERIIQFDAGEVPAVEVINNNPYLTLRLGHSSMTDSDICMLKNGDDTFEVPLMVMLRGHLVTEDNECDVEDYTDESVSVFYFANKGICEVSFGAESPSSRANDLVFSALSEILFGSDVTGRLNNNGQEV